uniref:Uncharacterized protein n=1 Tax=Glossina palpalis gambiensis TaxID=67801 RepID=A0A1B0BC84_9MUSC
MKPPKSIVAISLICHASKEHKLRENTFVDIKFTYLFTLNALFYFAKMPNERGINRMLRIAEILLGVGLDLHFLANVVFPKSFVIDSASTIEPIGHTFASHPNI